VLATEHRPVKQKLRVDVVVVAALAATAVYTILFFFLDRVMKADYVKAIMNVL